MTQPPDPVDPVEHPDPRALLRKYDLRAKKSWGQNFLVDVRALDSIVKAAAVNPGDTMIEIGAGLGPLTARLCTAVGRTGRLIAVERDRDMVAILKAELGTVSQLEIAEENALHFDYGAVFAATHKKPVVVGNLPYQIASPILFRLLSQRSQVSRIVVMLQLEMAQRVVAAHTSKDYSALSVMVRLHANARIAFRVPPGAFHPPPKVTSAVVVLELLGAPRVPLVDEDWFGEVVHAAFGQRRKTLRNALRVLVTPDGNAGVGDPIETALREAGIDGQRRGETLTIEEFGRLANALHATTGGTGKAPGRPRVRHDEAG